MPDSPAPVAGTLSFPTRRGSPLAAVAARMLLAVGLLVLSSAIVYLDRYGYRDSAHPGRPLSVLGSIYFATVSLSTIGYGDIVPVTTAARLVNTVVITPMRLLFLIILVGTTLQVLTRQTRTNWRIARWRSKMADQTIVIGYGTKGRSAVRTLCECGTAAESVVVVDVLPQPARDANAAGLVAVTGDGTRREVLGRAEIGTARLVVIAVNRDDTAVLIALTARQLNPSVTIVAAVREEENQDLLRLSGADQVVVSSGAAGQLLAISAVRPAAGRVIGDILDRGRGFDLVERLVTAAEVGRPARDAEGTVIALVRGDEVVPADHPAARRLAAGDRLILVSSHQRPIIGRRDTTKLGDFTPERTVAAPPAQGRRGRWAGVRKRSELHEDVDVPL
ncbi:TrkA family potassium uptake protein [Trebonia sp.]|uniref:potassium channel family protein n=1 Tax=Trebonia sp. TaxID=2767075 RepID=UPI00261383F6|nr:potassium channel family protein [Trebonia sp.]